MSETQFERIVEIMPAYDKRDPNPMKNYGIHCVELRMVLRGPKGATQFVLYTGWNLPHVQKELDTRSAYARLHSRPEYPMPADLGYHSPTPRWEGQTASECSLLPGGVCYYGGSGLNAERIYQVLLERGSDGVWSELENYYRELFEANTES